MFKKFTIILLAILFVWNVCLTVKKNKEKFVTPLSSANLQAIKNLGDLAGQITSASNPGKLTLKELVINDEDGTNFNILDTIKSIIGTNTTQGESIIKAQQLLGTVDSRISTAISQIDLSNYVSIDEYNYFKKLMSNHTHDFLYPGNPSATMTSVPASDYKNKKPVVGLLNISPGNGECQKTGVLPLSDDTLVTYFKDKNYTIVDNNTTELQKISPGNYNNNSRQMCKIHDNDPSSSYGIIRYLYKDKFHQ